MLMFPIFFVFFTKLHSDQESTLQMYNPDVFALIILKTWEISIIIFPFPKQNPADKTGHASETPTT